jgi:hypothetical protein
LRTGNTFTAQTTADSTLLPDHLIHTVTSLTNADPRKTETEQFSSCSCAADLAKRPWRYPRDRPGSGKIRGPLLASRTKMELNTVA